jgi:hypothetical protein
MTREDILISFISLNRLFRVGERMGLLRKSVSGIMLAMLLTSMLTLAFNIQAVDTEPKKWHSDRTSASTFCRSSLTSQDAYDCERDYNINDLESLDLLNETKLTRPVSWVSPIGSSPVMFNKMNISYEKFSVQLTYQTEQIYGQQFFVLVDSLIYNSTNASIIQYAHDVELSGISVSVFSGVWGSPEDKRSFLQQRYSKDLIGCLLVGDIPEAWYETDRFGDHEEYPIDLFYMDLHGDWVDGDRDGKYDKYVGTSPPSIYVGRLKASTMSGNEVALINHYFEKNHQYRTGKLCVPNSALAYIDDDFVEDSDAILRYIHEVFPVTTLENDFRTTNAENYKERLRSEGFEWLHVTCHGWSGGHVFSNHKAGEGDAGAVYSSDYSSIDPRILFYVLDVCSGSRYVEKDYLAGACAFAGTGGLAAIGATSTWFGIMVNPGPFYETLAKGGCIGAAVLQWFHETWIYDGYNPLSITGDPLLKPLSSPPPHDLAISELKVPPHVEPQTMVNITTIVTNIGANTESNITLTLSVNGSIIDSQRIDILKPRESRAITCPWSFIFLGNYNVTSQLELVPYENFISYNTRTKMAHAGPYKGFILIDLRFTPQWFVPTLWIEHLNSIGFVVNTLVNATDARPALDDYDVYIIMEPQNVFSGRFDGSVLPDFVSGGNGLFVVGCRNTETLSNIIRFTGIRWETVGLHGRDCNCTPTRQHPITQGLNWVRLFSEARLYNVSNSPEFLLKDDWNNNMLAVQEFGAGRVVALADRESARCVFYNVFTLYDNVVDWLTLRKTNIRVTSILTDRTTVRLNQTVRIDVTVENPGNVGAMFNVTVYYETQPIAIRTNIWLSRGETKVLTFHWNTTNVSIGTYKIKAEVSEVTGEANTNDNVLVGGTITIVGFLPTDLNKDWTVNILDVSIVARAFGTKPGDEKWNEMADLDKSGVINIIDVSMVARDYGRSL